MRRVPPNQVKLASGLLSYLTPGELLDPAQLHRLPPGFGLHRPIAQADSFQPLAASSQWCGDCVPLQRRLLCNNAIVPRKQLCRQLTAVEK